MTHSLRIKICGITQPAQGRAIAQMGATSLGFICATRSPRYVTPEQIAQIVEQLPIDPATGKPIDRVGVFVDASIEEIRRVVTIGCLNVVQLHGSESREFCQQLRADLPEVELVKALRIRNLEALQDARNYEDLVDALLLDAYDPTLYGGTGKTLDWDSLKQFHPSCSWILAGGLTPENVVEAVTQTHPDGIDLSSGVERSPGDKDLAKVAYLFEQLNFEQWGTRREVEAIAPVL